MRAKQTRRARERVRTGSRVLQLARNRARGESKGRARVDRFGAWGITAGACEPLPMKSKLPFLAAALATLGHVLWLWRAILRETGGAIAYPLDDPFIHLALARHLAFDGVYGVTKYAFTSASSSVAWPFALAALMKVFGNHAMLPPQIRRAPVWTPITRSSPNPSS